MLWGVCVWGGGGGGGVWFARSATAGMKYVGTTFIVGKISTGGRCTICKDYRQDTD